MANFFGLFTKKDRALGVSREKRKYDLGLQQSSGSNFLMLLIGLMTFLAMLAIATSLTLNGISEHWSSGLENKITIEIPATKSDETARSRDEMNNIAKNAEKVLNTFPAVKNVHILTDVEISDLISPWLGEDLPFDAMPVPGLISLELSGNSPASIQKLEQRLNTVADNITIDTHKQWLADVLKFTRSIQIATLILGSVIIVTTIIAVSSAVGSQIAVHQAEIELLHLIGARDSYIAKQFQFYTLFLSIKGSLIGMVFGLLIISIIGWIYKGMEISSQMQSSSSSTTNIIILALLPIVISIIAALTARKTVTYELSKMP